MLILVDQDGVIADFDRGFYEAWQKSGHEYPAIELQHRRSFYVKDDYPSALQTHAVDIITAKGFFRDMPPIVGAVESLNQLLELGHDVRICTSPLNTYKNCVQEKYEWVERNLGLDFVSRMIVTKDKTVVVGDILIDDKPSISGTRTPIWKHIIYDQPYNRHVDALRLSWANFRQVLKEAHPNFKHRYTLGELIQQCDSNAEPPSDLMVWDTARPTGNEVIDDTTATVSKNEIP